MSPGFCSMMLGLSLFCNGMHFLNAAKTRVCFFLFPWAKHLTQPLKPTYMLLDLWNYCFTLSDECSLSWSLTVSVPRCWRILFCYGFLRLYECVLERKHSHMNFFGGKHMFRHYLIHCWFFLMYFIFNCGGVCLCVQVLVCSALWYTEQMAGSLECHLSGCHIPGWVFICLFVCCFKTGFPSLVFFS